MGTTIEDPDLERQRTRLLPAEVRVRVPPGPLRQVPARPAAGQPALNRSKAWFESTAGNRRPACRAIDARGDGATSALRWISDNLQGRSPRVAPCHPTPRTIRGAVMSL